MQILSTMFRGYTAARNMAFDVLSAAVPKVDQFARSTLGAVWGHLESKGSQIPLRFQATFTAPVPVNQVILLGRNGLPGRVLSGIPL